MKSPFAYIQFLDEFLANDIRGAKVDGGSSREDIAAFRMAIYLRDDPIEIRTKGKDVYLVRKHETT